MTTQLSTVPRFAAKPFVKWAGGKTQLLVPLCEEVRRVWPRTVVGKFSCRYFEPFVGGGALFFAMRAMGWEGPAVLNDSNSNLMTTYRALQSTPSRVVALLSELARTHTAEKFLFRREIFNAKPSTGAQTAALLIYLNKTCFNGLYRVNKKGEFNVPLDPKSLKGRTICDEPNLLAVHQALKGVMLLSVDFEAAVRGAKRGDLVYFDPPYTPLTDTAEFTAYTKDGFGAAAQERLMMVARDLKAAGVHVILSAADTPAVRRMYDRSRFNLREVKARRNINSVASKRGPVGELIIT